MNIAQILLEQADVRPDTQAIVDRVHTMDRAITFAQANSASGRRARLLSDVGLAVGDTKRYGKTFNGDLHFELARVRCGKSEHFGISIDSILLPGKHPHWADARSVAAYPAVKRLDMDSTTVGRRMDVGQSEIIRAVTWEQMLMRELDIYFP